MTNSRWLLTLPGIPKEHKKLNPLRLGIEITVQDLLYYPGAYGVIGDIPVEDNVEMEEEWD